MHKDEYTDWIKDFTENEVNLDIDDRKIERFANRSKELESDIDFDLESIKEELFNLVLPKYQENDEWGYFVEELAGLILDEIDANAGDSDTGEDDDE